MTVFEFSITAKDRDPDPNADDFESRFYDNGCEDALVAFQNGQIILDFAREADSLESAMASARENVLAAGRSTGLFIVQVTPQPIPRFK